MYLRNKTGFISLTDESTHSEDGKCLSSARIYCFGSMDQGATIWTGEFCTDNIGNMQTRTVIRPLDTSIGTVLQHRSHVSYNYK
jgi:hypothetical protein